jgi:phenylacetic acid degradation operon negative regulatory protein
VAHRLRPLSHRRDTSGADCCIVNARSALFDVYGDHLRSRGGVAPVACLVAMMAPLGISAPAVRTAISRMVKQGWLEPVRLPEGPGYQLSQRAERRLADAAARIYRTLPPEWDGRWHLVVIDKMADRTARRRLRNAMAFLGYALLRDDTWISPRASGELDALLDAEAVRARRFFAVHDGTDSELTAAAWDVEGLDRSYDRWLVEAAALLDSVGSTPPDRDAFVARSRLVHEWRKFLFRDPGLPRQLLPPDWTGEAAAEFFDRQASRLLPAAGRFVDGCLQANGEMT